MNTISHILHVMKENIFFLLLLFVSFLTPIHGMLLTTGAFVLIDTLFAIYVSIKINGLSSYKSAKLFNIVPKTFFYMLSIILAFLVDKYIIDADLWSIKLLITKVICGFWIYIEIKSLDETSMKLGNKSIWLIIKDLLTKAKDFKKDLNELKE